MVKLKLQHHSFLLWQTIHLSVLILKFLYNIQHLLKKVKEIMNLLIKQYGYHISRLKGNSLDYLLKINIYRYWKLKLLLLMDTQQFLKFLKLKSINSLSSLLFNGLQWYLDLCQEWLVHIPIETIFTMLCLNAVIDIQGLSAKLIKCFR